MKVEICRVCGKISTPSGVKTSSKDCQLAKRRPCDVEKFEMSETEVDAYCKRKGWRPLFSKVDE